MLQNKTIYYLGLNDCEKHAQIIQTEVAINRIKALFANYNITIQEAKGYYENELETTLIITVIGLQFTDQINTYAETLANNFNQTCVLVETQLVDTELIYNSAIA